MTLRHPVLELEGSHLRYWNSCDTLETFDSTATRCNTQRALYYLVLAHATLKYVLTCHQEQHAATRCNTHVCEEKTAQEQHAATRCNTLQHTATRCNTLQHTATRCNTLQHAATTASTLLSCPRRHMCVAACCSVLFSTTHVCCSVSQCVVPDDM